MTRGAPPPRRAAPPSDAASLFLAPRRYGWQQAVHSLLPRLMPPIVPGSEALKAAEAQVHSSPPLSATSPLCFPPRPTPPLPPPPAPPQNPHPIFPRRPPQSSSESFATPEVDVAARLATSCQSTLVGKTLQHCGGVVQAITEGQSPYRMLSVSPGWVQLTGYSRDEAIGRPLSMLQGEGTEVRARFGPGGGGAPLCPPRTTPLTTAPLPPSSPQAEGVAAMMSAVDNKTAVSVRLTNYTRDGESFEHLLSVEPLRDPAGETLCFQVRRAPAFTRPPSPPPSPPSCAASLAASSPVAHPPPPSPLSRFRRRPSCCGSPASRAPRRPPSATPSL